MTDTLKSGNPKPPKPTYPNVRCSNPAHPDAPGYLICAHVLNGASPIMHLVKATGERLGEIRCGLAHHEKMDFVLQCAKCVRVRGVL